MSKASIYFKVDDINGKHETKKLKRELDKFHGVISVSVSDAAGSIAVDYDTSGVKQEQLKAKIEELDTPSPSSSRKTI
jgi:copper chaperone CopZ